MRESFVRPRKDDVVYFGLARVGEQSGYVRNLRGNRLFPNAGPSEESRRAKTEYREKFGPRKPFHHLVTSVSSGKLRQRR